jgi:hypothetical protein
MEQPEGGVRLRRRHWLLRKSVTDNVPGQVWPLEDHFWRLWSVHEGSIETRRRYRLQSGCVNGAILYLLCQHLSQGSPLSGQLWGVLASRQLR